MGSGRAAGLDTPVPDSAVLPATRHAGRVVGSSSRRRSHYFSVLSGAAAVPAPAAAATSPIAAAAAAAAGESDMVVSSPREAASPRGVVIHRPHAGGVRRSPRDEDIGATSESSSLQSVTLTTLSLSLSHCQSVVAVFLPAKRSANAVLAVCVHLPQVGVLSKCLDGLSWFLVSFDL